MDKLYGLFLPSKFTILITIIVSATIISSVIYYSEVPREKIRVLGPSQIDVEKERIDWETINTHGPELMEARFLFNSQSNKAMIFSGWDTDENDLNTTWVYDFNKNVWINATATMKDPENQPAPRIGYSGAYDPINDKIILFGGFVDCYDNFPLDCESWSDTWSYDIGDNNWTNLNPYNSPPPHAHSGMVYDSESHKMVLFGGIGDDVITMGETWVYDPMANNWTNMVPIISPPKRHAPSMAYNSEIDRIILFGGTDPWSGAREDHMNDTWSYDLNTNTWIELSPSVSPSKRIVESSMFYISEINKILFIGGWLGYSKNTLEGEPYNDAWVYDYYSNNWTEITNNMPLEDPYGTFTYNTIDSTLYWYDFTEFELRKGNLTKSADQDSYRTITTQYEEFGIPSDIFVISLIVVGIMHPRRLSKTTWRKICG